ncbi:hypothetical protein [Microlunatus speluncae]|uniref:hypothetical protein n=1 Tax=Microlunatus speluncae TaxID=2594267 RepID=UPI001266407A|nr:hypothetical protein [Microlunatus speluncae]
MPADPEIRIDTAAAARAPKRAMCGPCWELAHKIASRQAAADRMAEWPDLFTVDLDPADEAAADDLAVADHGAADDLGGAAA